MMEHFLGIAIGALLVGGWNSAVWKHYRKSPSSTLHGGDS